MRYLCWAVCSAIIGLSAAGLCTLNRGTLSDEVLAKAIILIAAVLVFVSFRVLCLSDNDDR
jgi:hypothetical protein